MYNYFKYVTAGLVSLATVVTGYFYGTEIKDTTVSVIEELTKGNEPGSPGWFKTKERQIFNYTNQIKDLRYNLTSSTEWNTRIVIQFGIDDYRKACYAVVNEYNEQAALKTTAVIESKICD